MSGACELRSPSGGGSHLPGFLTHLARQVRPPQLAAQVKLALLPSSPVAVHPDPSVQVAVAPLQ
jgi:hypothetical protein